MTSLAILTAMYEGGSSIRQIAASTGVPRTTVRGRLLSAGVKLRPPCTNAVTRLPWSEYQETVRLYEDEGMNINEVADALGIHPTSVRERLVRAGVTLRSRSYAVKRYHQQLRKELR